MGNRIDKTLWGTTERRMRLRRHLFGKLARRPGVVDQYAALMHAFSARGHHDISDAYSEEVVDALIRQYLYISSVPLPAKHTSELVNWSVTLCQIGRFSYGGSYEATVKHVFWINPHQLGFANTHAIR